MSSAPEQSVTSAQRNSPGTSGDNYNGDSSTSPRRNSLLEKSIEQELKNAKHLCAARMSNNTDDMTSILSHLLHSLEEYLELNHRLDQIIVTSLGKNTAKALITILHDQSKNVNHANEVIHVVEQMVHANHQSMSNTITAHTDPPSSSLTFPVSLKNNVCVSTDDDWLITQSLIFQGHLCPLENAPDRQNLSTELINCLQEVQNELNGLTHAYKQTMSLVERRTTQLKEQLKMINQIYEQLLDINRLDSVRDICVYYIWNTFSKVTDELESLCNTMSNRLTFVQDLPMSNIIFDRYLSKEHVIMPRNDQDYNADNVKKMATPRYERKKKSLQSRPQEDSRKKNG